MLEKSKDKILKKYYRLNPSEFLDLLENWRNTCKRQENIIIEFIKCVEKIEQDISKFQIKTQTIFGETTTSLNITHKTRELLAKAKKEISKDMASHV